MNEPTLYLMFGFPGAGKTTIAGMISEISGAFHLSSDDVRLELFPTPTFTQAEHTKLYAELDKRLEKLLLQGKSVIYDANLNRRIHRQEKYDICNRSGAEAVLIWVKTNRDMSKNRATHPIREKLWPKEETPDQMFDRVADVIEEPTADEKAITINGAETTAQEVRVALGL